MENQSLISMCVTLAGLSLLRFGDHHTVQHLEDWLLPGPFKRESNPWHALKKEGRACADIST